MVDDRSEASDARKAGDPGLRALSRRRLLRGGAAAVALGGALWGGVRLVVGSAPSVSGLRTLDARQFATLRAVANTLFPAGALVRDLAGFATRLAREGDARMARLPAVVSDQLCLALLYVEAAPVLLDATLRTFSRLDATARDRHWLEHWERTDDDLRRGAGAGLRRMLSLWAYDLPELWPAMHYPGPALAPMPTE